MCFCYLQDVGGIVKAPLNTETVYLLMVFMIFTCFNSHHYVNVNDCVVNSSPSNVRVYRPFIVITFR